MPRYSMISVALLCGRTGSEAIWNLINKAARKWVAKSIYRGRKRGQGTEKGSGISFALTTSSRAIFAFYTALALKSRPMPRPLRRCPAGLVYHVLNRAVGPPPDLFQGRRLRRIPTHPGRGDRSRPRHRAFHLLPHAQSPATAASPSGRRPAFRVHALADDHARATHRPRKRPRNGPRSDGVEKHS
jgi:hypothetical protein